MGIYEPDARAGGLSSQFAMGRAKLHFFITRASERSGGWRLGDVDQRRLIEMVVDGRGARRLCGGHPRDRVQFEHAAAWRSR